MPHRNLEKPSKHQNEANARFSPEKYHVSKKAQMKMTKQNMKSAHYDDGKYDQPNDAFQTVDVDIAAIGINDDLDFDDFKVDDPRQFNNTAKVGFTDELKTHSVQVFG